MVRTTGSTVLVAAFVSLAAAAAGQTPAPFPRPGQPAPPTPAQPVLTAAPPVQPRSAAEPGEPTEATLGAPLYPSARFIASYDAGRGQRYYLFGTEANFLQIVTYYKTVLRQKGDLVFEVPPIHMFELGKFREETMAFAPSVTVKDYTWGGSLGYLNPKRGGAPERYKTIIQVVPAPPVVPR